MTKVFEKGGVTGRQGTGNRNSAARRLEGALVAGWGGEMRMGAEDCEKVMDKVNRPRAIGE